MAGVRNKPRGKVGKYQGWFIDSTGDTRYFTGTRDRSETKRMAMRLEDDHRQVRLGYRPAASSADRHRIRPVAEAVVEYLAWGESQGGRNGHPWGDTHARNRRAQLAWWQQHIGFVTLGDLPGILPRVETELRRLQHEGRTGKTLANYAESLGAFCDWCVQRGYLADDPLKALAPFDTTPTSHRRAMTAEEIAHLLASCAPHRRLLYETAFMSGLRANELRNLTVEHVDVERGGLRLDAAWTKNRRDGFQRLPQELVGRLLEFGEAGQATRLYARFRRNSGGKQRILINPLLYVPSHTSRDLGLDLEAAGIPRQGPGGKVDFHACRTAYVNLVLESGASVKETQKLARHSTPEMTMNVYGRAREERLSEAVECIGEAILPKPDRAPSVSRLAVAEEQRSATPLETKDCASSKMVEAAGIEPASENSSDETTTCVVSPMMSHPLRHRLTKAEEGQFHSFRRTP